MSRAVSRCSTSPCTNIECKIAWAFLSRVLDAVGEQEAGPLATSATVEVGDRVVIKPTTSDNKTAQKPFAIANAGPPTYATSHLSTHLTQGASLRSEADPVLGLCLLAGGYTVKGMAVSFQTSVVIEMMLDRDRERAPGGRLDTLRVNGKRAGHTWVDTSWHTCNGRRSFHVLPTRLPVLFICCLTGPCLAGNVESSTQDSALVALSFVRAHAPWIADRYNGFHLDPRRRRKRDLVLMLNHLNVNYYGSSMGAAVAGKGW